MKKFSFLLSLLTVLGLYSCSQEDAFLEGTPSQGLTAGIPAYQFDSETRIGISENLNSFTWSDGDKIGVYYETTEGDAGAWFKIRQGGSSTGEFFSEAYSLKPNSTYYAFYPYNSEGTIDSYPVDFTGQVQSRNGGTEHIGARNYMSAVANTDENASADISFQNLAAVIQMVIPIEKVGTYTGVSLITSSADFITQGTVNVKTSVISAKNKSHQMELSFSKSLTLNIGDVLIANFLVAPVDLTGKTLTVKVKGQNCENIYATGLGKKIEAGKAYRFEKGEMNEIPYLTFSASETQKLHMTSAVETLEYSINDGDWKELGTNTVEFGGANGVLRMRGKSSIGTAKSSSEYSNIHFLNESINVICSGDIRTLVDYENYDTASTENARFCNLFSVNQLCLTSAPELPATTLADYCYSRMFDLCQRLTQAPELPATTLANSCYSGMFSYCTNLTTAPELPATTLADYCYSGMFSGCFRLTQAPELPATTLATSCYESMFSTCINLTQAPEIPATTLAPRCYYYMFSGSTNLTQAPELPATTLAPGCYREMFSGCTNLTQAPELPATTLADDCYREMFYGCTYLTQAPELPATTLAPRCYYYMFQSIENWNFRAPGKLPATTLADDCYYGMFAGCTNLTQAPELPATTLADCCYKNMFSSCLRLTQAPELPATTLAPGCYREMFYRCTYLTQAPELPATTLATSCYESMFCGCTNLTQAPELPATTLADDCYYGMFIGCLRLTQAPELPATTLAPSCYKYMFSGCTYLSYIKMMATDIYYTEQGTLLYSCFDQWTNGVKYTGTFVKNAAANWSNYSKDDYGERIIPSGWTVEYATE